MKVLRHIFLLCTLMFGVGSLYAKSIDVESFAKAKKGDFECSKEQALISLKAPEDGFTFNVKDKQFNTIKVGDKVQFLLPDGSRYFTISHETHGTVNWKIPLKKGVKRKRVYEGEITVEGVEKEYKIDHQWLVVKCNPPSALVRVDSTYYRVEDGQMQLYLPLGRHAISAVSPLYESHADSVTLEAERRADYTINMTPIYSFLSVDSSVRGARVLIDGKECGVTPFRSYKLAGGEYSLELQKEGYHTHRERIYLRPRQNGVFHISLKEGVDTLPQESPIVVTASGDVVPQEESPVAHLVPTSIKAYDAKCEIWINRQRVGEGEWQGDLAEGFYAISTSRDFYDSRPQYIWVAQQRSLEVNLSTPLKDYGSLNIEANEIGATIFINGVEAGHSPMVIPYLPLSSRYLLRVEAEGRKAQERWVELRGNDMLNVKFELK